MAATDEPGGKVSHPYEDLMRQAYAEHHRTGSFEALLRLMTDDMEYHVGGGRFGGDFHGRRAGAAALTKLSEWSGGTFRAELHDVLANDRHAVVLFTAHAVVESEQMQNRFIAVYHMREGQITEAWIFRWGDWWDLSRD